MPRQDVPYGGAICRLKERLAEIWDKLGEKLHSINGVEGDAAGDVKIVSGDAAIVVSSDQVNHEIEIALDTSQLPAAAVSSVNGQTGVVVLDGDDIELINGAGVTAANAIITNGQRLATLQGDLNTEISDRQTADAALQDNINTVQASIPTAAATAVANDPTVAQLATDVPNKLDKITSGSTLKAYTHTGATQGETSVVDGTAANSIGVRDANGRMQAADPANGATDKTLVTANWVSQTGAGRPNNLIHDSGNENVNGMKTMSVGVQAAAMISTDVQTYTWYKVARINAQKCARMSYQIAFPFNNKRHMIMDIAVITPRIQNPTYITLVKMAQVISTELQNTDYFGVAFDPNNNAYYLFVKTAQYTHHTLIVTSITNVGKLENANDNITPITPIADDPTTYTNYAVI